ncbi:MAG TPA: hypothetical protein VFD01_01250 [Candidatus Dormibacteraeota bacterium]|nr:hypothetical protein [Candidatus Dormibacteraeota bacterium]
MVRQGEVSAEEGGPRCSVGIFGEGPRAAAYHPGVGFTTRAWLEQGPAGRASMERVEAAALEVGRRLIRALAGWWLRAREERVHRQLPVGWKVVGERQRTVSSRVGAVLPASHPDRPPRARPPRPGRRRPAGAPHQREISIFFRV